MRVEAIYTVDIGQEYGRINPYISGCEFLPSGKLIICDYRNRRLTLLSSTFTVEDYLSLPCSPWDVSAVDSSTVIVSFFHQLQLQYAEVEPILQLGQTIKINKRCYGIAVAEEEIFTSPTGFLSDGKLRTYDMTGKLKRRIGAPHDQQFWYPEYITVSQTTNRIVFTDSSTSTVTCLTATGDIIYQHKDKEVRTPRGVCVWITMTMLSSVALTVGTWWCYHTVERS